LFPDPAHDKENIMSADLFHLNRPVHLARQDVFYEKAVRQIQELPSHKQPEEQCIIAERALFFLCEARFHAEAANRSEKTSVHNRLFVEFIDTAIDNTQSITRMLHRRIGADKRDNPLDRFLGSSDVGSKMSRHYRRSAEYILKGLLAVLKQAERPFYDLQQTSLAKMSTTDEARYEKARSHFKKQADSEADKAIEHLMDM
jgi:hypothetical protein